MMNDNDRHHEETRERPDKLTRLLRNADPAVRDAGLTDAEAAEMRRTVTDAARLDADSSAHFGPWAGRALPTLAAAAAVSVVLLAVSWFGLGSRSTAPTQIAGSIEPPAVAESVPSGATEPAEPAAAAPQTAAVGPDAVASIDPQPAPDAATGSTGAVSAITASSPTDQEARTRTVQFTAPRGTRIIWTLDPEFESPISGPPARQEQGK